MDKAALVGVLQSQRRLANVLARLNDLQRAILAHHPGQVGAVDKFHREVIGAVDLVGVIGADNVRMAQLGGRPNLALKTLDHLGVVEAFLADDLEGDVAVEHLLAGLEDLPHAPFAEPFREHERPQDQPAALALENLIDLEGREPAALEQLLRHLARLAQTVLELHHCGALVLIE